MYIHLHVISKYVMWSIIKLNIFLADGIKTSFYYYINIISVNNIYFTLMPMNTPGIMLCCNTTLTMITDIYCEGWNNSDDIAKQWHVCYIICSTCSTIDLMMTIFQQDLWQRSLSCPPLVLSCSHTILRICWPKWLTYIINIRLK